jgi:hypothetical protein
VREKIALLVGPPSGAWMRLMGEHHSN